MRVHEDERAAISTPSIAAIDGAPKPTATAMPPSATRTAAAALGVLSGKARRKKKRAKNAAAVALGSIGGKVRAMRLTPEQRLEISRKASAARWPGSVPE
jgi:hypothetical protein